ARQCAYRGYPLPLVFMCEDNGLGISVPTPKRWIEEAYAALGPDAYMQVDGGDIFACAEALDDAMQRVRSSRAPIFVHMKTVRLLGHAGSDIESAYRSASDIRVDEEHDPLLQTARALVAHGMSAAAVQKLYDDAEAEVREASAEVCDEEGLRDAADVLWCLGGPPEAKGTKKKRTTKDEAAPEGLTLAESIRHVLTDEMEKRSGMIVFGEDVGKKGGVYGVTRGLQKSFGVARVFDSLLDEQSILGMAIGAGQAGLLPVCEIQYLAYLHNAIDQLRGEASTLQFFSERQFRNPMVVRIAGYAYQKGFGGHFHNDNSIAALRDIPGLVIASPSRPEDAAGMLRSCIELAETEGTVSVFLEPIALYHTRDCSDDDGGWLSTGGPERVEIGKARTHGRGKSLTIVSFANGLRMSLRVAARLRADGITIRVVDLRWIAPLPIEDVLREAQATGKVLIVDETRKSGGVSEALLAGLVDAGFQGQMARVTSLDSFIPLGPAADHVLLGEAQIEAAVLALLS
ncbi:MAG: 2-oxoisovalerate dehydrogenase E1 component, partial [Polyangiales bacterium]